MYLTVKVKDLAMYRMWLETVGDSDKLSGIALVLITKTVSSTVS